MRTQPRKMSLTACISRCPATTRCPESSNSLAPMSSSSTSRLLRLQEQRVHIVVAVVTQQQQHPRPGADAAHTRLGRDRMRSTRLRTRTDPPGPGRFGGHPALDLCHRRPAAGGLDCGHRRRPFAARRALPTAPAAARPLDALRPFVQAGRTSAQCSRTTAAASEPPTTSPTAPSPPDRDERTTPSSVSAATGAPCSPTTSTACSAACIDHRGACGRSAAGTHPDGVMRAGALRRYGRRTTAAHRPQRWRTLIARSSRDRADVPEAGSPRPINAVRWSGCRHPAAPRHGRRRLVARVDGRCPTRGE